MEQDWTEKYRPTSLSDVLGNAKAVNTLLRWARDWEHGPPAKPALILAGSPGIGKTSTALALASEMGWGVIELNASDDQLDFPTVYAAGRDGWAVMDLAESRRDLSARSGMGVRGLPGALPVDDRACHGHGPRGAGDGATVRHDCSRAA